jgi:hypothetical protein
LFMIYSSDELIKCERLVDKKVLDNLLSNQFMTVLVYYYRHLLPAIIGR